MVFVGTDRIQAFGLREPAQIAKQRFEPLFDGRTLAQWRGDQAYWSVRDGAITGESSQPIPANTFLIHERPYRNFELRFKYRFLTKQGNSGVQHSSRVRDEARFLVAGYQANVVTPERPDRVGMLWDEGARELLAGAGERVELTRDGPSLKRRVIGTVNPVDDVISALRPFPEWNEGVVIAHGRRLLQALNGRIVVDVTDQDPEGRADEGIIALQLHAGAPMGVQFKDVDIRESVLEPNLTRKFVTRPVTFPVLTPTDQAAVPVGRQQFELRCAACHLSGQPGIPRRESLTKLPRGRIVDSLLNGLMKAQAIGMTPQEVDAVAVYLTSIFDPPGAASARAVGVVQSPRAGSVCSALHRVPHAGRRRCAETAAGAAWERGSARRGRCSRGENPWRASPRDFTRTVHGIGNERSRPVPTRGVRGGNAWDRTGVGSSEAVITPVYTACVPSRSFFGGGPEERAAVFHNNLSINLLCLSQ